MITLIYDGECPFCTAYARYAKVQNAAGGIKLINARDSADPAVKDTKARGYDLDRGMVAIVDGQYYHGDRALQVIANLSSRSDLFNKLNYHLFRSKTLAVISYPFLRFGRCAALKLKGVGKIMD